MEKADLSDAEWDKLFREVRDLLIYQAQKNQPIGYGRFCGKITTVKMGPTDEALHDVLGEISVVEHKKGNGMLSAFVGGKDSEDFMPGKGFFKQAMDLGIPVRDWKAFVKSERAKVRKAFPDPKVMTI